MPHRITRRQLKQLERRQGVLECDRPKPPPRRRSGQQFAPTLRCPGCRKQGPGTYALGPDGLLWHLDCRDEAYGKQLLGDMPEWRKQQSDESPGAIAS